MYKSKDYFLTAGVVFLFKNIQLDDFECVIVLLDFYCAGKSPNVFS